jgi:hypothetical protein
MAAMRSASRASCGFPVLRQTNCVNSRFASSVQSTFRSSVSLSDPPIHTALRLIMSQTTSADSGLPITRLNWGGECFSKLLSVLSEPPRQSSRLASVDGESFVPSAAGTDVGARSEPLNAHSEVPFGDMVPTSQLLNACRAFSVSGSLRISWYVRRRRGVALGAVLWATLHYLTIFNKAHDSAPVRCVIPQEAPDGLRRNGLRLRQKPGPTEYCPSRFHCFSSETDILVMDGEYG